ncbi:hypothetical protein [Blastopirellula marina]|uniref:Uncharacterized protein n=1 Tax=Blastopirellula marina TaxID=124 RepID=A0A2S8G7L0_9BACT|nr:hypothetical protein [Blastopirellula marina]PQO40134.1 hypothetical protein C5Y98_05880 [Blastopirellula marina]PQO43596.1 hypothetical protein C5Y93_23390 [Blastopirellula marina]PTL45501.1 hypothetical protein C5Y97_05880 [Blastopirellula marina]
MTHPVDPNALAFLVGQPCWGIVGGAGTGSMISLRLGQKIPRDVPLTNDKLSREIRENDAEFEACLFCCSWRLVSPAAIVCSGAWSSNEPDGPMLAGLAQLQQQKISEIKLTPETLDLSLTFENGLRLDVFNDYPAESPDHTAFWIETPNSRFLITGFRFDVETRADSG